MSEVTLYNADCLDVLATLPPDSVDSVITDPPAGISFMGKDWDSDKGGREQWVEWLASVLRECYRVAKPGAMMLCWALPRTSHWTGMAIERAGWEVRDVVTHVFGSGFPKSLDLSKAIDKAAGVERTETIGRGWHHSTGRGNGMAGNAEESWPKPYGAGDAARGEPITAPATDAAREWQGWGTALKPAVEFWWLAMKPIEGTFAANALKWGVAGLNVDGCRVHAPDVIPGVNGKGTLGGSSAGWDRPWKHDLQALAARQGRADEAIAKANSLGRWPANLITDGSDEVVGLFPQQKSGAIHKSREHTSNTGYGTLQLGGPCEASQGSAARFFYAAKASRSEREQGLEDWPVSAAHSAYGEFAGTPEHGANNHGAVRNHHPTVKPLALMRYLCRLTSTPTGGVVLDPFLGSGTTGVAAAMEGRDFIGIEVSADYYAIAERRIAEAQQQLRFAA